MYKHGLHASYYIREKVYRHANFNIKKNANMLMWQIISSKLKSDINCEPK